MMKNLLLLLLLVLFILNPFGGISADESDPCMGEDPVSPVLADYYNEFKQTPGVKHNDEKHSSDSDLNPITNSNSLTSYYSEFLK
ncbi:MAG: hypothetical protein KZQ70_02270 [gamma proteobacterium symbiont of Lucinoma myriamae]|nr:hypothetical protein [gamma proteobacterium symbiont of Lucinoma myriamae]MCU7819391.1 hypothetical protein [gamma proteobacterium symbiont of Lucinoma myriamae]MCU7831394.1 hypothetical protein [gamma proteobacterium symbiont of Lucinoma myriamae]